MCSDSTCSTLLPSDAKPFKSETFSGLGNVHTKNLHVSRSQSAQDAQRDMIPSVTKIRNPAKY